MKRCTLALVGGTVAWAAIGAIQRRKRSRTGRDPWSSSGPWLHPLTLASLVMPGIWNWDPGGVFGGIWSFLGGVTNDIKNFVIEAIDKAMTWVVGIINTLDDWAHAITNGLTAGFDWLTTNAVNAAQAVAGVVQQTYEMLDGAFSNLRDQLKSMLEHAYDDVKDFVLDQIPDILRGLLGGAWDILEGLIELGTDGVSLLLNFVRDPIGFIWELIRDLVLSAIAEATDVLGFSWEVFWGLFWPLLARQIGVPEDPRDMIDAAHLLWTVALAWVSGDFEGAIKKLAKGGEAYFAKKIPEEIHKNADLLVGLVYAAMGISEPPGLVEQLRHAGGAPVGGLLDPIGPQGP